MVPFARQLRLLFLGGLIAVAGCKREGAPSPTDGFQARAARNHAVWVEQLETLGYFRHLPADQINARKEAFLREGWNALFSGPPHRLNPADAEDLAKGGLGEFIRLIRPFLQSEGVRLPEVRDEIGATGYTLHIGAVPHVIYTREELQRETSGDQPELTWGLSMVRGFAVINQLLQAAGSPERLYPAGGGNDLFGFFLTPELFAAITQHPDASPTEAPYLPQEQYPNFGHPEWLEAVVP